MSVCKFTIFGSTTLKFILMCFIGLEISAEHVTSTTKSSFPTFPPNYTLIPSEYQFQCDIPPDWFTAYSKITPEILWPNGRIPYELDPNFTPGEIEYFALATNEFHENTCIRFEPRYSEMQTAYLKVERDSEFCAIADFCYKGQLQYLKFGEGPCAKISVLIHMLGHVLCLPHEHERWERDEFTDFSKCSADEIPQKLQQFSPFKGYPYDFASQMHYECEGCAGGVPKVTGVDRCGQEIGSRLGVLDADKINEIYNCQGCYRHRWRSTDKLTNLDKRSMIPFGYHHHTNQPMYLCRAFVAGEISPGKYRLDVNLCYVPSKTKVVKVKENVQVFTLPPPNGTAEVITQRGIYMTVPLYNVKPTDIVIPVGRNVIGDTIYAGIGMVGSDSYREKAIGKVYANALSFAHIPYEYMAVKLADYDVLVCRREGI